MRRALLIAVLLAFLPVGSYAMKSAFRFEAKDVYLERLGADSVLCRVRLNVLDDAVANHSAVVLQPYAVFGGVRGDLTPASFYRLDGRGRRAQVRGGGPASGVPGEIERVCGVSRGEIELTGVLHGMDAVDTVGVYVDVIEVRKNKTTRDESRMIALCVPSQKPLFEPDYYAVYVTDRTKYRFDRYVNVPLRVQFEDGKNSFKPSLGLNEGEIYEFGKAVGPIIASKNTRVSEITMTAFCGIEGSVQANQVRMKARLNNVYAYLRQGVFARRNVKLAVEGEDWKTLQEWFSGTSWHLDRSLNDIIYGPASKDSKERNLKECVTFWRYMEDNLFPELERFECSIRFSMLDYADDEQRWAAYNEDPRLLSQYDFSCLLRSMTEWTASWYDMVFEFAEVYPLCSEAQVNALAASLRMGNTRAAADILRYVSGNDGLYYKAVWLMMEGRIEEAYEVAASLDATKNPAFASLKEKVSEVFRWRISPTPWEINLTSK